MSLIYVKITRYILSSPPVFKYRMLNHWEHANMYLFSIKLYKIVSLTILVSSLLYS